LALNISKEVVLLSGGGGNLGRSLKKYASEKVHIIDVSFWEWNNSKIESQIMSSMDNEKSKLKFIHTAWPVSEMNYLNSKSNKEFLLKSKENIQWLVGSFDIEICGIGSVLEAGSVNDIHDDTPADPESYYAESKAELNLWLNQITHGNYKWLRISNQFSRFDPQFKLIPQLLSGGPTFLCEPNFRRDYIHVSDSAKAVLTLTESQTLGVSLISTGESISPLEIAESLGVSVEYDSEVKSNTQNTFPDNLFKLGWTPNVDLSSIKNNLNEETLD